MELYYADASHTSGLKAQNVPSRGHFPGIELCCHGIIELAQAIWESPTTTVFHFDSKTLLSLFFHLCEVFEDDLE